jgi:hypothetical protein
MLYVVPPPLYSQLLWQLDSLWNTSMYSVYDNDQFTHVPTAFPIFCFVHALFFAPVKKKKRCCLCIRLRITLN